VTARTEPHLTKSARRRLVYALAGIVVVLAVGALGFHFIAGLDAVNSLYFESMLATGQGPPLTLTTDNAKIFASIMAFISVGSVVSALLFSVGPVVRIVWHNSIVWLEREGRDLERDIEKR
jgi:biotin transporter BioY